MSKKCILFVDKFLTPEAYKVMFDFKAEGYTVTVCDGNIISGFEDSCDKVHIMKDFPHVQWWCEKNDIQFTKTEDSSAKEEQKEPVKQTDSESVEAKEEKPKPRARRQAESK